MTLDDFFQHQQHHLAYIFDHVFLFFFLQLIAFSTCYRLHYFTYRKKQIEEAEDVAENRTQFCHLVTKQRVGK